jgi:hypothetical protein
MSYNNTYSSHLLSTYSLPARNVAAWSSCSSPVLRPNFIMRQEGTLGGPLRPALHTLEQLLPPVPWTPHISVVKTTFRRDHINNKRCPAKTDRRENAAWTEGERAKAEAGYIVEDIKDLHKMVCELMDFVSSRSHYPLSWMISM